ncbi:hypothetical protein B0H21DRAFT_761440 [Amylocystis lapponica]|nr:hypothetical protein B0H21DRAFT_761440 [Amylocystis lapponica]
MSFRIRRCEPARRAGECIRVSGMAPTAPARTRTTQCTRHQRDAEEICICIWVESSISAQPLHIVGPTYPLAGTPHTAHCRIARSTPDPGLPFHQRLPGRVPQYAGPPHCERRGHVTEIVFESPGDADHRWPRCAPSPSSDDHGAFWACSLEAPGTVQGALRTLRGGVSVAVYADNVAFCRAKALSVQVRLRMQSM